MSTTDANFWQVTAWQAAVFGGLITAFLAVLQALIATRQRSRELRWKKAETGRDLADRIFSEPLSNAALLMLDSEIRSYKIGDTIEVTINVADMLAALTAKELPQSPTFDFIRDAFDTLYFYLDRIEHFIGVGLTSFEDVQSPLDYYVDYLAEDKQIHLDYIGITRYTRVTQFLDRFHHWQSPRAVRPSAASMGLPAARVGVGASKRLRRG
jgi:hypothetical protein